VVVQSDQVASALGTTLVVPFDDFLDVYQADPLAVRVSPKEAGTREARVALPQYLTSAGLHRFEPTACGRLRPASMQQVDMVLAALLALPAPGS